MEAKKRLIFFAFACYAYPSDQRILRWNLNVVLDIYDSYPMFGIGLE